MTCPWVRGWVGLTGHIVANNKKRPQKSFLTAVRPSLTHLVNDLWSLVFVLSLSLMLCSILHWYTRELELNTLLCELQILRLACIDTTQYFCRLIRHIVLWNGTCPTCYAKWKKDIGTNTSFKFIVTDCIYIMNSVRHSWNAILHHNQLPCSRWSLAGLGCSTCFVASVVIWMLILKWIRGTAKIWMAICRRTGQYCFPWLIQMS